MLPTKRKVKEISEDKKRRNDNNHFDPAENRKIKKQQSGFNQNTVAQKAGEMVRMELQPGPYDVETCPPDAFTIGTYS